jgi:hypothetical protein
MEEILYNYLKANQGEWFKKVHLYTLADEHGYSPETAGRCLRDLAESGKIEVGYYDGKFSKHLAKYSYNPQGDFKMIQIKMIDGKPTAVYA